MSKVWAAPADCVKMTISQTNWFLKEIEAYFQYIYSQANRLDILDCFLQPQIRGFAEPEDALI